MLTQGGMANMLWFSDTAFNAFSISMMTKMDNATVGGALSSNISQDTPGLMNTLAPSSGH